MAKQITAREAYSSYIRNTPEYKEDQKRINAEKRQQQKEADQSFIASLQTPTSLEEMQNLVNTMNKASKKVQKAIASLFLTLRNADGFIVVEDQAYFTTDDGYVVYSQKVQVAETVTEEIEAVAESLDVPASEVAKIASIAQEAKQGKQAYVEADAQELAERTGWTQRQEEVQHMEKQLQSKPVNLDELRQLIYTAEASLQDAVDTLAPLYKDDRLESVLKDVNSAMSDLDDIIRKVLPEQPEIMITIERVVASAFNIDGTTPAGVYVDEKCKEQLQPLTTQNRWNTTLEVQGQLVDVVYRPVAEMDGEMVAIFHDEDC